MLSVKLRKKLAPVSMARPYFVLDWCYSRIGVIDAGTEGHVFGFVGENVTVNACQHITSAVSTYPDIWNWQMPSYPCGHVRELQNSDDPVI